MVSIVSVVLFTTLCSLPIIYIEKNFSAKSLLSKAVFGEGVLDGGVLNKGASALDKGASALDGGVLDKGKAMINDSSSIRDLKRLDLDGKLRKLILLHRAQ